MDTDDFVREFVRGRIEPSKLAQTPLPINLSVVIYPMDVALGLVALHRDSARLQEWAELIDAADFIHFESFDVIAEGDLMLQALGLAIHGSPVPRETIAAAARLGGVRLPV